MDNSVHASLDSEGNIILGGELGSGAIVGDYTFPSGGNGGFIAKFSANGEFLWNVPFISSGFAFVKTVALDDNNNIYAAVGFNGTCDVSGVSLVSTAGTSDVFVAKYDPSGNLLFVEQQSGSQTNVIEDIAVDGNGDVITTGRFGSNGVFGDSTLSGHGNINGYVWKLDSDLNHLWVNAFDHEFPNRTRGLGVDIDENNDIYFAGYLDGEDIPYAGQVFGPTFGRDPFLARINTDASEQWLINIVALGSSSGSFAYPVGIYKLAYHQNNVYGIGSSNGPITLGTETDPGVGGDDIFIVSHDANGNFNWARTLGSTTDDFAADLSIVNDKLYAFFSFGDQIDLENGTMLTPEGGVDACVLEMSLSDGTVTWFKQIEGSGNAIAVTISSDGQRKIVLSGFYTGEMSIDSETYTSNGDQDIFYHAFSR